LACAFGSYILASARPTVEGGLRAMTTETMGPYAYIVIPATYSRLYAKTLTVSFQIG
jgi:hypothetical protein